MCFLLWTSMGMALKAVPLIYGFMGQGGTCWYQGFSLKANHAMSRRTEPAHRYCFCCSEPCAHPWDPTLPCLHSTNKHWYLSAPGDRGGSFLTESFGSRLFWGYMRRSEFGFLLCHKISWIIQDCQCLSCDRDRISSLSLALYHCSCLRCGLWSGCVQWTVFCRDLLKTIEHWWNSDQSLVASIPVMQ